MSRDILFAAIAFLKSNDVIAARSLKDGICAVDLSPSTGTMDLPPRLGLSPFFGFPSFVSSSSSIFDMVLKGNCIKLQVHRTRMVIISV